MPRQSLRYIVDEKGSRQAVIIPLKTYREITDRIAYLEETLGLDRDLGSQQEAPLEAGRARVEGARRTGSKT